MSAELLSGASSVLLTWVVLIAVFIGIGLPVFEFVGLKEIESDHFLGAFWVGLSATILYLLLWNLLLPVNDVALAIPCAVGALGLATHWSLITRWKGRGAWSDRLPAILVIAAVGLWIALRAMGPPAAYETGSYHLPAVNWAKSLPVVPGLANLHWRLGFNNSNLLLAALVDRGPWEGRSTHIVSGLFLFALMIQIVLSAFRIGRGDRARLRSSAFDVILFFPVVVLIQQPDSVSSLRPDLATAVVLFVAASGLVSLLSGDRRSSRGADEFYVFVVTTLLLALSVSLKLSAAAFAASGFIIALWWWRFRAPSVDMVRRRALVWVTAASAAMGLSWMARGVVLTGYPAYPSTIGGMPVDWRVPAAQAEAERAWIEHFGRYYYDSALASTLSYRSESAGGWGWTTGWAESLINDPDGRWRVGVPLLVAALALLAAVLARVRGWGDVRLDQSWWLLLPIAAGGVLWFVAGPRPTFGYFVFWIFAALATSSTAAAMHGVRLYAPILFAAILFGTWPVARPALYATLELGENPLRALAGAVLIEPGEDDGFYPPPTSELERFTTDSGLELYVLAAEDNRCWNGPILCTPHPSRNLRLRDPQSLRAGFTIDGAWEPLRWPHPSSDFLDSWLEYEAAAAAGRDDELSAASHQ